MNSWLIFTIGIAGISILTGLGVLLYRRRHPLNAEFRKALYDARLLLSLSGLAILCIMFYIAYVFGKR